MKNPDAARPRILIVEREPGVAATLERSLVDLGYVVVPVANTIRKAIRLVEEELPDLVLLDIRLKGTLDGIDAANEIVKGRLIPVVFLTANTNDEVFARARAASPHPYLTMPVGEKELNATILVALHQQRRAPEFFAEHTWLRTMVAGLSDAVIATDAVAQVRYLNPAAERLTAWMLSEALGKPIREVFRITTLAGEPVHHNQLERALTASKPIGKERFLLGKKGGAKIPIEDCAVPIMERGRISGAVCIFTEITERLCREQRSEEERDRMEEQVQSTAEASGQTRAELRVLAAHLMTAQEEERTRIARELHDDLGQRVALLEMQLARAEDAVANGAPEVKQLLTSMREHVAAIDSGLRSVSHRLHPSILEDLGLVAALRLLIRDLSNSGSLVSLRAPNRVPVSPKVATVLYRVAQEALRNALKHAPGARIRVTLTATRQALQLTVQDAGPGFDVNQARARSGLGLLSMQERARSVNGTLLLKTCPSEGTVVTVRVPAIP